MADNTFLQAFQTGASLYDKAQSRKMEQAQMEQNVATFALQREHEDLNQKLGTLKLAQEGYDLQEKKSEAAKEEADQPVGNKFLNDAVNWSMHPNAENAPAFVVPPFQSKKWNENALKIYTGAMTTRLNTQDKILQSQTKAVQSCGIPRVWACRNCASLFR